MLEWLNSNIANIVIIAAVLGIVMLVIVSMVRDKKAGKSSCGCNCSHCAMAGKCHPKAKKT
jgi:hypothetical protein